MSDPATWSGTPSLSRRPRLRDLRDLTIGGLTARQPRKATLDRDTAEWFARRFSGDSQRVLVGTVSRDAVLAYLIEREEEEIIARPDDVTILATERVES